MDLLSRSTAFYAAPQRKQEATPIDLALPQSQAPFALGDSFENSPRRRHLAQAGDNTIVSDTAHHFSPAPRHNALPSNNAAPSLKAPLPLLLKTFAPFTDLREEFWFKIAPYFRLEHFAQGEVLWQQGDEAEGMYVIEHGILKAVYQVRLCSSSS